MLSRGPQLERVAGWPSRRDLEMQVRLARDLVVRCRAMNREIAELDRDETRVKALAPALLELSGCASVTPRSRSPRCRFI